METETGETHHAVERFSNLCVFTNASIIGKGNFVEKNIGLGVSAVAMENPTDSVAGEYWLDGEKVDAPTA